MKFKQFLESKEKKIDKADFYKDYFKNLCPKNFVVKKEKDKIIIQIN